jgi:hypothetical protein
MVSSTSLLTTLALALGVSAMDTTFGGCKYSKISGTPWHNCNDYNGGKDPCPEQQNCLMACGRAGSKDNANTFVMVSEYNGPDLGTCNCVCYLK